MSDDDEDELVECDEHGSTAITYVCQHLVEGSGSGVHSNPVTEDDPTPDAWCDRCDEILEAAGGEWTEEAEKHIGIKILCTGCYAEARARNTRSPLIPKRSGL